jgi:16S rRNA (cytidine1402-2'-O)-methyltransferase
MLYVIATPIGNLEDLSQRALDTLIQCDFVLCEDTRHSKILLDHYGMHKNLISYHKFSERKKQEAILQDLKAGKKGALISDAGTPAICDPGYRLIEACHAHMVEVVAIPGPCAFATALSISGFEFEKFQFLGFLSKKENEKKEKLLDALTFDGISCFYETSKRIEHTLHTLKELAPARILVLAKELTKKYEKVFKGTAESILEQLTDTRGEYVLLIDRNKENGWEGVSIERQVAWIEQTFHVDKKQAIKITANLREKSKHIIYNHLLKKN